MKPLKMIFYCLLILILAATGFYLSNGKPNEFVLQTTFIPTFIAISLAVLIFREKTIKKSKKAFLFGCMLFIEYACVYCLSIFMHKMNLIELSYIGMSYFGLILMAFLLFVAFLIWDVAS